MSVIKLNELDHSRCREWTYDQDFCITCGVCAGACPVSGVDDFDPRKLVRLVSLGRVDTVEASRWPWICTMCGKCEQGCPMGIQIPDLVRRIRSLRDRDRVPGILHKGLEAALETGNNLRIPGEDFAFIIEDVAEELADESDAFRGFTAPIDKEGAGILTTIHNKLVNTHTEDLKHWWKIFHAAGEDFTIPGDNWEGTSWGYFTGDDEAMKTMAGRILAHLEKLRIRTLLWPE